MFKSKKMFNYFILDQNYTLTIRSSYKLDKSFITN